MITITEAAAVHIKTFLDKRGSGIGVNISVKTTGCSGYAYVIEVIDAVDNEQLVFKQHGVTITTDVKSHLYLDGVEIDYVIEKLQSGLKFNNPTATTCGCGESFTV